MQDSENKPQEPIESPAPSPEPSPAQPLNPQPQNLGVREIQSTYEMIVKSKTAIQRNDHWHGEDLQAMAMLMMMLNQMEGQYRSQLDHARAQEKDALKRAKEEIRKAGGQVNGDAGNNGTVPAAPAA